jgi:CheY-like chemotaxis protein/two-component sensor histidine kinase
VARITRNRLELRKERVVLADAIQQAVEACRPMIDAHGHRFTLKLPQEPVHLDADPVRLAQVFGNLINNACKYTPPGGRITVRAREEAGDVVVSVTDTGIGIAAEMLPKVFDLFAQADGSLEQSRGGLGIGLTLVKQLVELHGGQVDALSTGAGGGSTFTVRLPTAIGQVSNATGPVRGAPAANKSQRVLVVDDNRDGAASLTGLLQLAGHETLVAHDGLEAVAAAERWRPDIVLLDLGLPTLNGFDTCRRIRQQPWGVDMVLVAITGWGQEEYRRRSHEAGFNDHLVKPVNPTQLLALIAANAAGVGPREPVIQRIHGESVGSR